MIRRPGAATRLVDGRLVSRTSSASAGTNFDCHHCAARSSPQPYVNWSREPTDAVCRSVECSHRENVRFNPTRVATNTRQSPASSTRSSRYCLPASFSNSDDRATQTSSAQAVERFTGALSLPAGRFRLVTVSRIPAKPAPMREDCTLQAVAAALLSIRCPQSFAVHVGRPPIAMLRTGPGARFDQLDRDPAAGAFSSGPVDLCPPCWGRCCHLQGLARASASCRCLHRSTARAREPASRIARRIACGGGCTSR